MKIIHKTHIYFLLALISAFALCRLLGVLGAYAANYYILYSVFGICGLFNVADISLKPDEYAEFKKPLYFCAVLLSLTNITGLFLSSELPFSEQTLFTFTIYLFSVAAFTPFSLYAMLFMFGLMKKLSGFGLFSVEFTPNPLILWIISFFSIIFCWNIIRLAYFPGLWNYDIYQIQQYQYNVYNKFHPLLHTLLLGFCHSLGDSAENSNFGVTIYYCVQMSVMASIFAYLCVFVVQRTKRLAAAVFSLCFFALFPVNQILAISSTKDSLFTAFVTLFILLLINLQGGLRLHVATLFVLDSVLLLSFRNNAIYVYIILLFAAFILVMRHEFKAFIPLLMISAILLFFATDYFVTKKLNADPTSIHEMLSVPSQQMGRIHEYATDDALSLSQIEEFYSYPEASYKRYISDSMKNCFIGVETTSELPKYISLYFRLWGRHPLYSLDSFLYLTKGAWYVADTSVAAIYGEGYNESYYGYMSTEIAYGYNVEHESKIPILEKIYEHLFSNNEYQKLPLAAILFSPALYIWILLFSSIVFFKTNNPAHKLAAIFMWALYLTILAGPCILVRYMYPFMAIMPLLLCLALSDTASKEKV